MADKELPNENRPRDGWWLWLGALVAVTFLVRVGLGAVARVVDVVVSVIVLGVVAALGWHFTVGAMRRRRRS